MNYISTFITLTACVNSTLMACRHKSHPASINILFLFFCHARPDCFSSYTRLHFVNKWRTFDIFVLVFLQTVGLTVDYCNIISGYYTEIYKLQLAQNLGWLWLEVVVKICIVSHCVGHHRMNIISTCVCNLCMFTCLWSLRAYYLLLSM